jgi:hypothetical protein
MARQLFRELAEAKWNTWHTSSTGRRLNSDGIVDFLLLGSSRTGHAAGIINANGAVAIKR